MKSSDINRKFSSFRKKLEKISSENKDPNFLAHFDLLRKTVFDKMEKMKGEIERLQGQNRKTVAKEDRSLLLSEKSAGNSRIIFHARTGVVEIQLNKSYLEYKRECARELGRKIMETLPEEATMNLTGTMYWSNSESKFTVQLHDFPNGKVIRYNFD